VNDDVKWREGRVRCVKDNGENISKCQSIVQGYSVTIHCTNDDERSEYIAGRQTTRHPLLAYSHIPGAAMNILEKQT